MQPTPQPHDFGREPTGQPQFIGGWRGRKGGVGRLIAAETHQPNQAFGEKSGNRLIQFSRCIGENYVDSSTGGKIGGQGNLPWAFAQPRGNILGRGAVCRENQDLNERRAGHIR